MATKDGSPLSVCLEARCEPDGRRCRLALLDITARIQAQEKLRVTERALKTIAACNRALVRNVSEPRLLKEICQAIVEHCGYRMAWVGLPAADGNKPVRMVASAGFEAGYLEQAKITWSADDARGRGPSGVAFRTGEIVVCNDFQNDPLTQPWHREAAKRGYAAVIVLPLKNAGECFGLLMIYAAEPDAFQAEEQALLAELAGDLAFGLHGLRTREARRRAESAQRESDERYRALFERSLDCVYLNDFNGRFLDANPAALELLGYRREDISRLQFASLLSEDQLPLAFQMLAEVRANGFQKQPMVFQLLHRDGVRRVVVEIQASLIYRDGQPFAIQGIARDITERKRIEALQLEQAALKDQLTKIVAAVPGVIYSFLLRPDGSACFPYASPAIENHFGFTAEQLAHDSGYIFANVHPADHGRVQAGISESARTLTVWADEFRFLHPVKGEIWVSGRSVPQRLADGGTLWHGFTMEVTERRRLDEKLHASLTLYRSLVTHLPLGIFEKDQQGRYILVNPEFCRIKGLQPEDFLGKTPMEVRTAALSGHETNELTTKYAAAGEAHHRQIIKSGKSVELDEEYLMADGTKKFIHVMKFPVLGADGRVLGSQGVHIDITEHKRAAEALREKERLLQTVLDLVPHFIFVKDAQSRHLLVNRACAAANGRTPEQMVGCTDLDLVPDRAQAEAFIRDDQEVITSGKPKLVAEEALTNAAGERRILQTVKIPFTTSVGAVTALMGVAVDITDLKRVEAALRSSENRFRKLLEKAPVPMCLVESETGVFYRNERFVQIFGYTAELVPTLMVWWRRAYPDPKYRQSVIETWDAAVGKARATGRDIQPLEYRVTCQNGEERIAEISGIVVEEGILVTLIDQTDRKRAEEALRFHKNLLEETGAIAKVGGWYFDALSGKGFWTGEVARIHDLDPAVPVTKELGLKFYVGDSRPKIEASVQAAVDQGLAYDLELEIESAKGVRKWVRTIGHPVQEGGRVVRVQGSFQDITERKQAEALLRESEEQLRTMFELASIGIAKADPRTGQWLSVNKKMCAITGYSADELLRMKIPEITHPEDRPTDRELFQQVVRGERADYRIEKRYLRKDGTEAWVNVNMSLLHDAEGKALRTMATIEDITERKLAEAALIESEWRFRVLFQNISSVAVQSYGFDGTTHYWNRASEQLYGFAAKEAVGRNLMDLIIPPEMHAGVRQAIQQMVQTGQPIPAAELTLRRKDGSPVTVYSCHAIVQAPGRDPELFCLDIDITERKLIEAANAQLTTIVEQATETIVITDTHGHILYVNPAFESITGYTRAEVLGQNPRMLKSGRQDAEFYRKMWDTLGRGETWRGHFSNRRKDGSLYEEEATISAIRNANGEVINYVAVRRDVTHEVALELQLLQSQKMEAVGTLAGGIAHDFNNILTTVFGYSNLLQLDLEDNAGALEKVGEILKAGERAKDLVQQILTFSRRHELERQVIRLDSIVKEAGKLLRASLPSNISVDIELAADAPCVLADATQIYQVVMNLGTNALHAMDGGAGRLTIRLDAFQPDEAFLQCNPQLHAIKYARLTVIDTGHGMDALTVKRIFEPFFTTKPVGKGTGLGLAVVHGIVEALDGVVAVESEPGRGTVFSLYFPAQMKNVLLSDMPEGIFPAGRGQRILLVDDEAAIVKLYQPLLKALKYQATVTQNPREAIGWVRQNPAQFDLVITDLTMPEMTGLDLARQLHACRADLPIVLATGFKATVSAQLLADAGISELVEKPVSITILAEVLHRLLSGK